MDISVTMREYIFGIFSRLGVDVVQFQWLAIAIYLAFVLFVSLLGLSAARLLLRFCLVPLIQRSKTRLDDYLVQSKTLKWIARIVPIAILYFMVPVIFGPDSFWFTLLKNVLVVILAAPVTFAILSFISVINLIYAQQPYAKRHSVKGYMQVAKIIIFVIAIFLIISIVFDVSLLGILGGLGAFSAIVLLIFKDPILALMANAQLTLNDMVRIGDWIEIREHGVDGNVIDMNLQSIRIQNWDKTIVSVPLYDLISHSFINWRGMEEAHGRRIKRAINIDMASVRFCTAQMITRFKGYALLKDYIVAKEKEIAAANAAKRVSPKSDAPSSRAMTNLGTFRAYARMYLQNHPSLKRDLTYMVRQLRPTPTGIPIEIYCFSAEQAWVMYEAIQADIFDHLIAVLPVFGLRIFQQPSGYNIERLVQK